MPAQAQQLTCSTKPSTRAATGRAACFGVGRRTFCGRPAVAGRRSAASDARRRRPYLAAALSPFRGPARARRHGLGHAAQTQLQVRRGRGSSTSAGERRTAGNTLSAAERRTHCGCQPDLSTAAFLCNRAEHAPDSDALTDAGRAVLSFTPRRSSPPAGRPTGSVRNATH